MPHLFGSSASYALVVVVVVVAFGVLVIIHELGHFALARLCRMRVDRFSVGFGPVLLRRRGLETEWAVSAIPFGGYVKIAGMNPGEAIAADDRSAYANQPAWRRFLVILAGPVMNYLFAIVVAALMLASLGFREALPDPVVGEVVPGGAADRAGFKAGDRVLSVDGRPVATWDALVAEVVAHPGKSASFELQREGQRAPLTLPATPESAGGRGRLGIVQGSRLVRAGATQALSAGFRLTNERAAEILSDLGRMVSGRQRAELRGPLGIAQEMARSARAGAAPFVGIVWLISIALGLFNLLPLPALDGGRLVFLVYEIVTRRRVDQRVESIVHTAGFIALFGLLLAVTLLGDLPSMFRH
ncbi:MAG TPA: M50 family metallopeptidase [Anaeromyxobacteraceae bacterium]|nr:M50 family metallopeptidase [Anaeromyxobacteraceae bacterium]